MPSLVIPPLQFAGNAIPKIAWRLYGNAIPDIVKDNISDEDESVEESS
jgi:hypothetical protein